ncbi:MAG: hypothetical protein H6Q77_1128, partial [Gemmatimonadetes bacterium]|nr:hypothetical protein [Gemmatimonadota bacterium]
PAWGDSTAWVGIEWLANGDVPASAYDPATTALLTDIQRSSWAFIARRALGLVDSIPVVPLPRELVDPLTLGVYAAPHDMVYLRTSHHAPRTDATSSAIDGVPIGTFQVYVHELVHASQARDPEAWRALFRGVPRQKDIRRYGALNPLEQQADAASWALTTLVLERKHEWVRHPVSGASQEMPGVRRMLGIFLRHPVFTSQLDSLGRWRADSTVVPGDSVLADRLFRPVPNNAWSRALAVFGLQQEDPRWWRWMQVVGQVPAEIPDTTGPVSAE